MDARGMAGHLIRRLHQKSTRVYAWHTQQAGFDLTPVQFAALSAIRSSPGADQARVAAFIACDRATIGGVIDRLERKGLVARKESPRDRRARVLRLTEQGEDMYAALLPVVTGLQEEILSGLTASETARFLALAEKALSQAAPGTAAEHGGDRASFDIA